VSPKKVHSLTSKARSDKKSTSTASSMRSGHPIGGQRARYLIGTILDELERTSTSSAAGDDVRGRAAMAPAIIIERVLS